MIDGAHQGVKPSDALKTILGGEPDEHERASAAALRERILAAPNDMPPVTETQGDDRSYDLTCLIVARQVFQYLEAHPEHREMGDGKYEILEGRPPGDSSALIIVEPSLYDVIKENDAHAKEVFEQSGMTGFMWGWSLNAARRCLDLGPVPNPALVEVTRLMS